MPPIRMISNLPFSKVRSSSGCSNLFNMTSSKALSSFLGAATFTVAADLQPCHQDAETALPCHRVFQLIEQLAFELDDFAAAQAGHVHMIAPGPAFVEVTLALDMHQVQFVDQALPFEQADGPVDGDAVDGRIDAPRFPQDLSRIQMLFGSLNDAQDGATLPGQTDAAVHQLRLEESGSFGLR